MEQIKHAIEDGALRQGEQLPGIRPRTRSAPAVAHVADQGTTVFFSSHQIADVEQIADCVAIVDQQRFPLTLKHVS
jgi:hypothetical protein